MTREEVVVEISGDVTQLEKNLGIGKNYFARWTNALKTEEQKYSEWWNQELKKREEAEVAASVRAAQRSNLARKLMRERAVERGERIAEDLGRGSIPESWSAPARSAEQAAEKATGAFNKFGTQAKKEVRELGHVFSMFGASVPGQIGESVLLLRAASVSAVVAITVAIGYAWHLGSKMIADALYGNSSRITALISKRLDENREYWRAERLRVEKDRAENMAKADEDRKRTVDSAQKYLNIQDEIAGIERARAELQGGEEANRASKGRIEALKSEVALNDQAFKQAIAGKDKVKFAEAELALKKAQLALEQEITHQKELQKGIDAGNSKRGELVNKWFESFGVKTGPAPVDSPAPATSPFFKQFLDLRNRIYQPGNATDKSLMIGKANELYARLPLADRIAAMEPNNLPTALRNDSNARQQIYDKFMELVKLASDNGIKVRLPGAED